MIWVLGRASNRFEVDRGLERGTRAQGVPGGELSARIADSRPSSALSGSAKAEMVCTERLGSNVVKRRFKMSK